MSKSVFDNDNHSGMDSAIDREIVKKGVDVKEKISHLSVFSNMRCLPCVTFMPILLVCEQTMCQVLNPVTEFPV